MTNHIQLPMLRGTNIIVLVDNCGRIHEIIAWTFAYRRRFLPRWFLRWRCILLEAQRLPIENNRPCNYRDIAISDPLRLTI